VVLFDVAPYAAIDFPSCFIFSLQVWDYATARVHLKNCLRIASDAANGDRRHWLAQVYDELARKEWYERAKRGDAGSDVNVNPLVIDQDILKRACLKFDKLREKDATAKKTQDKSRASGTKAWVNGSRDANSKSWPANHYGKGQKRQYGYGKHQRQESKKGRYD